MPDFPNGINYQIPIIIHKINNPDRFTKQMMEFKRKMNHMATKNTGKITKKFYVGASRMQDRNNDWAHTTIEKAVEHARQLMEEEDSDEKIIVQIIRVVKRQRAPIIVEKV